jgi:hypothetical protein
MIIKRPMFPDLLYNFSESSRAIASALKHSIKLFGNMIYFLSHPPINGHAEAISRFLHVFVSQFMLSFQTETLIDLRCGVMNQATG